jgi:hypothetical protein
LASLILAQIVPPARENLNPQGDIAPAAPESVLLSQPPVPMEITPAPAPVSVPAIAPVIPAVISAPAAAAPKKRLYSCSGSEVEKCSGIASLIMTPEIKARLIMKAIRSQCLKNKNYCQINGQEVSIALLALDQDRNEVFGDLLSAPVDICDLNSVCRTGQSVRTLIVNYALERKGFGLLAELMIDKKFLGTTAEEKVQVLQELTSTFEGYLNQAPDAKAEMKPILAKLFTLAKAADDFVTLDRLIDNELINLDEVIEFR